MLNKKTVAPSKQKLIVYFVLIAVTLAVYWQVHQYNFVNFDDNFVVYENHHIQSSINWDALRWAFTTNQADLWSPFLWISLLIDYQFYGLNAGGYHVTNLILHILSALMLFWLFNRMTKALWPSAFVAAVFALHPLHVESVAWVTERKDVLSAFFWMLTLCLYAWYTEKPVIKRCLPILFCFFCGLMSKPMIVTLPVIMILLDYWPLNRFEAKKGNPVLWQLKEKTPFFILSAVFSMITFYVQYYIPSTQSIPLVHYPLELRLANASVSFVSYLEKTFWPHNMVIFYPFPTHIPVWQVIGAFLLILVITAFVIAMTKRLPYLFVGWLWYSIVILPVIKIVYIGNDAMADRYHYIPSVGISVMLAWGIPTLIKSENIRRNILLPATIVSLVVLTVLTWKQCSYWKNDTRLWSHALKATKCNYFAHINYGADMFASGNIKEAFFHYNEAISINPGQADAYNNRGVAYANLAQLTKALEDFNEAIHLRSDNAQFYNNRGVTYAMLEQYKNAIEDLNKAIELQPDYVDAYCKRGMTYNKLGRHQQAIEDYTKAINLMPDFAHAWGNRALVYLNKGDIESGCRDAKKACEVGNCTSLKAAKVQGYCH